MSSQRIKFPSCAPHLLHIPQLEGEQLAVAIMNLPKENSDARVGSRPPSTERRYTFGISAPLSLEKSDFGLLAPSSPESENEPGKHYTLQGLSMITT